MKIFPILVCRAFQKKIKNFTKNHIVLIKWILEIIFLWKTDNLNFKIQMIIAFWEKINQ
jgi:hypothetical protein